MNNKGMTTVEACFIIPFSFILICLILYTSFYYYDYTAISRAAIGASYVSMYEDDISNDELVNRAMLRMKNLLDGKLICMDKDEINVEVKVEYLKITVRVSGVYKAGKIIPGAEMFGIDEWNIDVKHEAPRLHRASFIRGVNILKNKKRKEEND